MYGYYNFRSGERVIARFLTELSVKTGIKYSTLRYRLRGGIYMDAECLIFKYVV